MRYRVAVYLEAVTHLSVEASSLKAAAEIVTDYSDAQLFEFAEVEEFRIEDVDEEKE